MAYYDVDRWVREGHRLLGHRVFCNDVDITDDCCIFDDFWGYAFVWSRSKDGRHYIDPETGVIARTRINGKITVRT